MAILLAAVQVVQRSLRSNCSQVKTTCSIRVEWQSLVAQQRNNTRVKATKVAKVAHRAALLWPWTSLSSIKITALPMRLLSSSNRTSSSMRRILKHGKANSVSWRACHQKLRSPYQYHRPLQPQLALTC